MQDSDSQATFDYAARQLDAPGVAYLHIDQSRIKGYRADPMDDGVGVVAHHLGGDVQHIALGEAGGDEGIHVSRIGACSNADMRPRSRCDRWRFSVAFAGRQSRRRGRVDRPALQTPSPCQAPSASDW